MNKLEQVDKYAARLIMLSFVLPMQIQIIALFAPFIYFIFRTFQVKEHVPVSNYLWGIFLGTTYLFYLFALTTTPPAYINVVHQLCEYRLSYLLIPVLFSIISPQKTEIIYKELCWFVYFSIAACLITNISFIVTYSRLPQGFKGVTHVAYRIYFEEFCGLHPTYMSMYLALSAGILFTATKISSRLKYLLFYVMLALLLPLLAKSPLIALALMLAHQAWLRRHTLWQYKWIFAGMLGVLALSYLFIPFVSQRIQEMSGLSGGVQGNINDNSVYVRKMIWEVDSTMARHFWLTGCGPGRIMQLLKIRYFFYSLHYGYNVNSYDPHNEYFYQWISFGLTGILFFIATLLIHFYNALKKRQHLYFYALLILIITSFTESVLTTQHGLIFYSFFTALFFFCKKRGEINQ